MRKLASIQKVSEILPIEGADKIQVAKILGWQCVVKRNEFSVGDYGVYFEIDSIIPRNEWSNFLFTDPTKDMVRVKTKKIRGVISQGILLPVSILSHYGTLVTDSDGSLNLILP